MALGPSEPVVRVAKQRLRELFDEGQYPQRARAGEFTKQVYWESVVKPPNSIASQEPCGTKSQIVDYRDTIGRRIARVHRYKRPDGTLGASGREDPKSLHHNGVYYILKSGE